MTMTTVLVYVGLTAHGTAVAIPYANLWHGITGRVECQTTARIRNTRQENPADYNIVHARPPHSPPLVAGGWHCIPVVSP